MQYLEETLSENRGELSSRRRYRAVLAVPRVRGTHDLRFDRRPGLVMVSTLGGSERVLTITVQKSRQNALE
jgi:hypothetical protein